AAKDSDDIEVRQEVVARLAQGLNDPNEGIVGSVKENYLNYFGEADYTPRARAAINSAFVAGNPDAPLVRLVGIANIPELMDDLGLLLIDEARFQGPSSHATNSYDWAVSVGWAARLARARMGSQEDIRRVVELKVIVDKHYSTRSGNSTLQKILRGNLAYVRQPATIREFVRQLNDDGQISVYRGSKTVRICVCENALVFLVKIIDGFPVKWKYTGYSQADIDLAREWMKDEKNWLDSIPRSGLNTAGNVLSSSNVHAVVEGSGDDLLAAYMDVNSSDNGYKVQALNLFMLYPKPRDFLERLKTYEVDASPKIRHRAHNLIRKIGVMFDEDPEIRQEVVARLVAGLRDPDKYNARRAAEYLLDEGDIDFIEADFSTATKSVIRELFLQGSPSSAIVKLVGVANLSDQMGALKQMLIDETQYKSLSMWRWKVGWSARLARARMGSAADIERVITLKVAAHKG
ncbi:MAG: hypothetical protein GY821_14320, partial [Gammaproteobacteria bacterium]|nr:hypothetical protein [Gammaproteobacteria bacterium]